MCNGFKANGDKCGRKAEWCFQHIDQKPTESAPVESAPVETAPVETAPVETAPVETAPVETAPVETAPVETAPVETAPVETAPVETAPVETSAVGTDDVSSDEESDSEDIRESKATSISATDLIYSYNIENFAFATAENIRNDKKHSFIRTKSSNGDIQDYVFMKYDDAIKAYENLKRDLPSSFSVRKIIKKPQPAVYIEDPFDDQCVDQIENPFQEPFDYTDENIHDSNITTEMAPQTATTATHEDTTPSVKTVKPVKMVSSNNDWFFQNIKNISGYIDDEIVSVKLINGPNGNAKRPSKISIGHETLTYEFCARVTDGYKDGPRMKYYWFVTSDEMLKFNRLVCAQYNDAEVHQYNHERDCSFFIDLDWKLDICEFDSWFDSKEDANMKTAETLVAAIRDVANDHCDGMESFQFSVSERSRQIDADRFKISLHVYTNIAASFAKANEFLQLLKTYLVSNNTDDEEDEWVLKMVEGFDDGKYRINSCLALPEGVKNGIRSTMLIEGLPPLINATSSPTHMRDSSMRYTNDLDSDSEESGDEDESSIKSMDGFMKEALEHVKNIPGYEGHNFKIFTKFGRGIRVNRKKSSHCGMCERDHDNDNTLLLFFNAKQGYATWRCDRAQGEKAVRFYLRESAPAESTSTESAKKAKSSKTAKEIQKEKDDAIIQTLDALYKAIESIDRNVIRDQNDLEFNDLAMRDGETMKIDELALLIRQTMVRVENNGEPAIFVKVLDERQYGREFVMTTTYIPRSQRQIAQYKYDLLLPLEAESNYDFHKVGLGLGDIVLHVKSLINHRKTVLEPYGVFDTDNSYAKRQNFNLFGGFVHTFDKDFIIDESIVNVWLNHIKLVLANNDDKVYDHLLKYFTYQLINPMIKTGLVLVVKGKQGSGKNCSFDIFHRFVLGSTLSLTTASMDLIAGRFNSLRQSLISCVLDEAVDNKDRALMNKFKNLITSEETQIEYKGKEPFTVRDFINYVVISNQDFASFIEESDRRAFCLETNDSRRGDKEYYKNYWSTLANEEAGKHIFHWLVRHVDIKDWTAQDCPRTEYKQTLKRVQASSIVKFLLDELDRLRTRTTDTDGIEYSDAQLELMSDVDKDKLWGEQRPSPAQLWDRYLVFVTRAKIKSAITQPTFIKDMQAYIPTTKTAGRRIKRYDVDILATALQAYL